MSVTIRTYAEGDRQQLIALLRLNIPRYFAPAEERDFEEYLDKHLEDYYVVEMDGNILGCGGINYKDDKTHGRISWDFFHPDSQGMGLGTMLMQFRIDKLKAMPAIKTISVRTTQLTYKFYARFGFEIKEIVKDYWAEGFDLYHMEMEVR